MSTSRRAIAMFAVTALLSAAATGLIVATWSAPVELGWGFRGYAIILAVGAGLIGLLLTLRVPANQVGWLVAGVGVVTAAQAIASEITIVGTDVAPGSIPYATVIGWIDGWIWVWPVAIAAIGLPLIFPSGVLSTPGDRRIAWFAVVVVAVATAGLATAPGSNATVASMSNPFGLPYDDPTLTTISGLSLAPLGVAAVLGAISVVRRFRRSSGELRQQLKWFALSTAGVGLTLGVSLGTPELDADLRPMEGVLVVAAFLAMLGAIGVAVLRYRLYDIDRIVSRSISYGLVTALLVLAYAAVVLLLQGPLGSLTSGDTIPVALSTLVVAGLFNPLRRRVQTLVDRRFDRARFDAERTASAFAERLREQVDLPMLAADLDSTVRAAIAPSRIGLWLRGDGR